VSELIFDVLEARAEPYAVAPTLILRLRVVETTGEAVHCLALRTQIRIEPLKRRYNDAEGERLVDLFGERSRWGDTMKPLQFAHVSQLVPGFKGTVEIELSIPLTYDFEVATAKYFHGLEEGEIPLLLLFSGTLFLSGETGFSVEQVPWHKEAGFRLPVAVWREAMDAIFPDSAWIRVRRDTLDALARYKSHLALPSWDDTLGVLLTDAEAKDKGVA
jgi:uncharacterized protein DUF6084